MDKLNTQQERLKEQITNRAKFGWYMLSKLPLGLLVGLRVRDLEYDRCITSIPFKNLNKNPFKSVYFAVQSMAAELSTASPCLLAVSGQKPSVAFIIVDLNAKFLKKATSRVYFTCEDGARAFEAVGKAVNTGTPQTATLRTTGRMADGTVVSEFTFTWSFKQRGL